MANEIPCVSEQSRRDHSRLGKPSHTTRRTRNVPNFLYSSFDMYDIIGIPKYSRESYKEIETQIKYWKNEYKKPDTTFRRREILMNMIQKKYKECKDLLDHFNFELELEELESHVANMHSDHKRDTTQPELALHIAGTHTENHKESISQEEIIECTTDKIQNNNLKIWQDSTRSLHNKITRVPEIIEGKTNVIIIINEIQINLQYKIKRNPNTRRETWTKNWNPFRKRRYLDKDQKKLGHIEEIKMIQQNKSDINNTILDYNQFSKKYDPDYSMR